jgi:hypothetical protein
MPARPAKIITCRRARRLVSIRLPGFADLGDVPYRTCSPPQGFGRRYGPS